MNDEPEFSFINIYFGTLLPIYIFHYILELLYSMFNCLAWTNLFILIFVLFSALTTVNREVKIWAKVV